MKLPTVRDIEAIRGRRIVLRASLNAAMEGGPTGSDFRLESNLDTIRFLQGAGARLSMIGHIERDGENSLRGVSEWFAHRLSRVRFAENLDAVGDVGEGELVIAENVRRDHGEKANDPAYAARLAALGELYVNEAFADSHREHASIAGIPKLLPSFIGFRFEEEVRNLSRAFTPEHPFVLIIGGAKFSTKLPLVERFLALADTIFIGGALAIDFYRSAGYETGGSLVSDGREDLSALAVHPKIIVAEDAVVVSASGERRVVHARDVGSSDVILDNGPAFVGRIAEAVSRASFVLWNGPLGNFERGYWEGTHGVAQAVAASRATSIVGGGDTVTAIQHLNLESRYDFVSTGGGAMLDFLARGTLPGIEAIGSGSGGAQ